MTNLFIKIVRRFSGGLVSGIIGYAVDIMFGGIFEAFRGFNSLFLFYGFILSSLSRSASKAIMQGK